MDKVVVELVELVIFLFEFLLLCLRECFFEHLDTAQQVLKELFVNIGDLVMAERTLVVTASEYPCRDTYGCGVGWYILDHDRVGTDFGILSYGDVPQYFGTGSDNDIVFECRVALAFVGADTAKCHLLIDKDIISDDCCLSDDHTNPVIDKDTPSELGGGVDVDHRQEHSQCGDKTGKKTQSFVVKPVGDTVEEQSPQSRVVEKEFKGGVECRVITLDIGKVFLDQFEYVHA
jgi:hypothetical protein